MPANAHVGSIANGNTTWASGRPNTDPNSPAQHGEPDPACGDIYAHCWASHTNTGADTPSCDANIETTNGNPCAYPAYPNTER
jgi:hypothetical protein